MFVHQAMEIVGGRGSEGRGDGEQSEGGGEGRAHANPPGSFGQRDARAARHDITATRAIRQALPSSSERQRRRSDARRQAFGATAVLEATLMQISGFASGRGSAMPTYFFNVRGDGIDVPDLTGRVCDDDSAARAEAERLAAELVETARAVGAPPPAASVEVDDEALRPILVLPVGEGAVRC